jgi:hypothetical protein
MLCAFRTWPERTSPVAITKSFEGNMTFIELRLLEALLVAGDQPLPQKVSPVSSADNKSGFIHPVLESYGRNARSWPDDTCSISSSHRNGR